jgi:hypothetical protein
MHKSCNDSFQVNRAEKYHRLVALQAGRAVNIQG